MATDFLDWALADFSGYVAADELYDGPFCILSAVDNRRYKRILYDVLDHDPTHDDIRAFLRRLHTALVARGLTLCGVTTDGSALYPEPLREVFGKVPHHICQLHIVAEVVKAVLGAVASARKGLAANAYETIATIQGIEGIWQIHRSVATDDAHNTSAQMIANIDESSDGHWIKAVVTKDGKFTLTNGRGDFSKTYTAR